MNDASSEWNEQYTKQEQNISYLSSADHFSLQKHVDRMVRDMNSKTFSRIQEQLSLLSFPAGSTVLDIGSGPGTLAVPLAKRGCKVTVVEPSIPMVSAMKTYLQESGVTTDIQVIPKLWEEVKPEEIGVFDYIISSFSLAVPNLSDALDKMNNTANRQVHIFWFLSSPHWETVRRDLWPELYGEEFMGKPRSNLVWNTLYQKGIMANLTVHRMKTEYIYTSEEEALAHYWEQFPIVKEEQKDIIVNYLRTHLVPLKDGTYQFPALEHYAHIWWDII